MYQALHSYIASKVNITDEEFELIKKYFTPLSIQKKEFILKKGEVCTHSSFIVKGALRTYFINDKEEKITIRFGIENWWAGDRDSFVNKTPSNYYVEAIEASDLLLIKEEDQSELYRNLPVFRKLIDKIKEANAHANQKRLANILTSTAEEKYKIFSIKYPEMIQRFPQHMVASYLGIKPETLSRLRRRRQ